jgi:hypothetical protein
MGRDEQHHARAIEVCMNTFISMMIVFLVSAALAHSTAFADSLSTVTISGRATDQKGRPLRGAKAVRLDFYDNAQGSNPIASLNKNLTLSDGGVFSYALADEDLPNLPDELWVRISIQGQAPLPMQRITSSFFARSAQSAKGAKAEFKIYSDNGNYISFKVNDDLESSKSYVLPDKDGADGDVLTTDGNAKLSWRKSSGSGGSPANPVDGANIGAGSGVYAGKNGDQLRFKSISGRNGISVTASGDTITIEGNQSSQVAMDKQVYDLSGQDGVVDNSERLGGFTPEFFRNASNINTGILSETYIDPSIARLNQVPYRSPQDLHQALSGSYAPATHTHSAFDITSGILMELFIDPAIARDSEITYKTQSDLRQALDDSYAEKGHNHNANQITQDPMHRFVSDGERLQWTNNASQISSASSASSANSLVRRDASGAAEFSSVSASSIHLGPLALVPHPQTPAGTQLSLPPNTGDAGQVLTADGQGGSAWSTLAPTNNASVRDTARNLSMSNLASSPSDAVQVSADEIILQDASGKALRAQNINISGSIGSKLDSGSEEASTWYHIWVLSNGQNMDLRFSQSSVQPSVSASTYVAYVGAVYNNASGDLAQFIQRGKHVLCDNVNVLQNGTSFTYAGINLASAVPTNAVTVQGELGLSQDFSVYSQGIYISANAGGLGEQRFVQYTEAGLTDELSSGFSSMLATPQTLYYRCYHRLGSAYCTTDRSNVFVRIKGWSYP